MTRDEILDEIRRLGAENGGVAPGKQRFADLTGITESEWSGRYWARWNDALAQAGYKPNAMQDAYRDQDILDQLIAHIREIGRFPTVAELRLRRRADPSFPSAGVFDRLGRKAVLAAKAQERCVEVGGDESVRSICAEIAATEADDSETGSDPGLAIGAVYLMKSGRNYKIGRSNSVGRREYELSIQLPDELTTVHVIQTDDPVGVEAYWHQRFADRWKRGEWFSLTRDDVRAFKRWKSIV